MGYMRQEGYARTEAAIFSEGTPFSADDLVAEWVSACEREGEYVAPQRVYEEVLRRHPQFEQGWITGSEEGYLFATDAESGHLEAASFEEACRMLDAMFTPAIVADGGWGWVEDHDGETYWVGRENRDMG